jgi:hypothetical protein
MCEMTSVCGTRAIVWHGTSRLTTRSGSIRPCVIGRRQPCTWDEGWGLLMVDNWRGRAQVTTRLSKLTYFAQKMG